MSTAPRPHTSPSMSSPPNGSCRQPSGFTGTTSVWPMSSSVGASGSRALDARDEARAPGRGLVALDVEPGAFEVGLRAGPTLRTSCPDVVGAVVHARVADEVLQEIGDLVGRDRVAHARVGLFDRAAI